MTAADDYSPERLADRAAITDVMYRWCRAVDRLDVEGIRGVFHPDAIDNHGPFIGIVDEVMARKEVSPRNSDSFRQKGLLDLSNRIPGTLDFHLQFIHQSIGCLTKQLEAGRVSLK